jgi:signal peptide peptidase SppA
MDLKYGHILNAIMEQPLLMRPEKVQAIGELLRIRVASDTRFDASEIEARLGAAPVRKSNRRAGAIAVMPLYGVIGQRMNLVMQASGGTSTQMFAAAFREAVADDDIRAIVLDVDSPGGSVYGVEELAAEIYKARGRKPIQAVVNSEMASAAYWIGSAADRIDITPSGMAGSIGVVTMHEDWSENLQGEGIKVTLVATPERKVEGNPYEPLGSEARDRMESVAGQYYSAFVKAVAKNRKTTEATVRANYGQGRMLTAKEALAAGMVDGIATLEAVLARLGGNAEAANLTVKADPELVLGSEDQGVHTWITFEPMPSSSTTNVTVDSTNEPAPEEAAESGEQKNERAERLLEMALGRGEGK